MKVLLTGGLGYIGSHTAVALLEQGYELLILDNCFNSDIQVLQKIEKITNKHPSFVDADIRNKSALRSLVKEHQDIEAVIHFAAFKSVSQSVVEPLSYYENNIGGLVNLLEVLQELKNIEFNINNKKLKFIFSSSCTVYGQAIQMPITEDTPLQPAMSPYGNTKKIGEEILQDYVKSNSFIEVVSLRYFNPIGAHDSALIGELPKGIPQNLVPFITQTAIGIRKELSVFGDTYDTPDGTCIRDYIHVADLANAHVKALDYLTDVNKDYKLSYEVFNIGTGKGSSVLEVVQTFEKVNDLKLNYKIVDKRQGDIAVAYADASKAKDKLGWKAQFGLEESLRSAWKWEQQVRKTK